MFLSAAVLSTSVVFAAVPAVVNFAPHSNAKAVPTGVKIEPAQNGGSPSFAVKIDYDFDAGLEYLHVRLGRDTQPGRWDCRLRDVAAFLPWTAFRAGEYTIPLRARGIGGKAPRKGRVDWSAYYSGSLVLEELAVEKRGYNEGVFFRAKNAAGERVEPGTTLRTGDLLVVSMQTVSPPDELSVQFYAVNDSDNWAVKGRWEMVEIPTAPTHLKPFKDGGLYVATFRIPKLPKALDVKPNRFLAAIHYAGGDSRDYGYYYGFCPYAIEFEQGQQTGNPNYRFLDFGPSGQAVQAGAEPVTPKETPAGFKWTIGPQDSRNWDEAIMKTLDASMNDWYAVFGRPTEFTLDVKPGRYTVVVGSTALGKRCYNNSGYFPLQGRVTVNGTTAWEYTSADPEKECFGFMDHEASIDEDVYEVYVNRPMVRDIRTTVDAADGKITVNLRAVAKKHLPLNYVVVFPAGDQTCERLFARQLENRRRRWTENGYDATKSCYDHTRPLVAKDEELGSAPLRMFARENACSWILHDLNPLVTEIGEPLRIDAAPGERTSGLFAVKPSVAAKAVEIELKGLPAAFNASVWRLMPYWFHHGYHRRRQLGANHFMPNARRDFKAGESKGYSVRFDVPKTMKPGLYRGTLVAKDAAGHRAELPLEVRVFDVDLPELTDHRIAMLGGYGATPAAMKFCKEELGCTTCALGMPASNWVTVDVDKDGKAVFSGNYAGTRENLERQFKTYNEVGFACREPFFQVGTVGYTGPNPIGRNKPWTDEYRAALKMTFETYYDLARANGLDNIVLDTGGEMGYDSRQPKANVVAESVKHFRLAHELVPAVKLSYRCNCWTTVDNFFPVLDVAGVRGAASWEHADRLHHKDIYTYSVSGRIRNGLHSWAHGAKGNLREWVAFCHHFEYNDLICQGDCGSSQHFAAMPAPGGTYQPTIRGDAFRASVIDRRFFRLLENAIAASKNEREKRSASEFIATLKQLQDDKNTDNTYPFGYSSYLRDDGSEPWMAVNMNVVRRMIVRYVKALEKSGSAGLSGLPGYRRGFFTCGIEDGPFQPVGRAVEGLVNLKPQKGEKGVDLAVRVKDAKGSVVFTRDLGTSAKHYRFRIPTAGWREGVYTIEALGPSGRLAGNEFELVGMAE